LLECPAIPLPIEHLDHARPTRTLFNGKPVPPGHTHCPQGRYNRLFWAPRGIKMKSKRSIVLSLFLLLLSAEVCLSQGSLSAKWEELTGPDFIEAIHQSQGVCVLPFGIIEKHGPHLPLGTDLLDVRFAVFNAVKQEYAVVFPEYYFGQIFEAQQQPGTVAYSLATQLTLLQETVKEMARNGCKKVVIVNGHGGNNYLLPLFAQAQMASPRDYVVYVFGLPETNVPGRPAMKTQMDMHAGESETSHMLIARPDLVHMDRATQESGADQKRQALPDSVYTGIWWYARFPNHYSGEGAAGNRQLGEFDQKEWSRQIAEAIKAIKADQASLKLQNQFFEESQHPMDTKQ
jgi:creatinine amidohydrolase